MKVPYGFFSIRELVFKKPSLLSRTGQNSPWSSSIVTYKNQLQCLKFHANMVQLQTQQPMRKILIYLLKSLFQPEIVIVKLKLRYHSIYHLTHVELLSLNNMLQVMGNLTNLTGCYPLSVHFKDPIQSALLFWSSHYL